MSLPDTNTLLLFMMAALALNVTPGPDMLYVVARSVGEGRAAGVISSLGIAAGSIVHTLAVALGLAGLLRAVPIAFEIVKWVGAAYLIWLGVRALRSRAGPADEVAVTPASKRAVFGQGMLTNLLNPKVALFFLAFLPQFVDPERGPVALQIISLGLLFNTSGTLVNVLVAVLASRAGAWSRRQFGESALLRRMTGVLFIGLGVRLALLERR
ncbi:MAG TPA: LysE family translocator [Gemmatimonadaceae bacterium]|nr:LysE family translocator [Gemmatimonadaceae bacterium]